MTLPRLARRPLVLAGGVLVALVVASAAAAPLLAPTDPLEPLPGGLRAGAPVGGGPGHPLGTDSQGRDVLSRLLFGARLSLTIGIGATAVTLLLGLAVGIVSGYFGGWSDTLLMRLTDVVQSFPAILLALALAALLPAAARTPVGLLCVIGLIQWTGPARLFRAEVLALRELPFVDAARAMGASRLRILVRHIAPHLLPTLLVVGSMSIAATVLLDAGLAFLGVGVPPPAPSWGSMLREAQEWYSTAPWLALWPGLAVLLTVGAFNLIAYDLQRSLARPGGK